MPGQYGLVHHTGYSPGRGYRGWATRKAVERYRDEQNVWGAIPIPPDAVIEECRCEQG